LKERKRFILIISLFSTRYQQFYRAYNQLILEIDRRYSHLEKEQGMVRDFLLALDENWKTETNQRKEFWELYGQYLPAALCPAIKVSPIPVFSSSLITTPHITQITTLPPDAGL